MLTGMKKTIERVRSWGKRGPCIAGRWKQKKYKVGQLQAMRMRSQLSTCLCHFKWHMMPESQICMSFQCFPQLPCFNSLKQHFFTGTWPGNSYLTGPTMRKRTSLDPMLWWRFKCGWPRYKPPVCCLELEEAWPVPTVMQRLLQTPSSLPPWPDLSTPWDPQMTDLGTTHLIWKEVMMHITKPWWH